jgi:hypothetical protein
MSMMNLLRFFLRALAEGGVVVCVLLAVAEWLLPGSVLPYVPLPVLAFVVLGLSLLTRGQGSFAGAILLALILISILILASALLLGSGMHALAVLVALASVSLLIIAHSYEKHPTLS